MQAKIIVQSQVRTLHNLRIHQFPAKPFANMRVVRTSHSGIIVGVDSKGQLYSSQATGRQKTTQKLHGSCRYTIEGLRKLGVLAQSAIDEHAAIVAAEYDRQSKREAAENMAEASRKLGLKLGARQLAALEKAAGGGSVGAARIADKLTGVNTSEVF